MLKELGFRKIAFIGGGAYNTNFLHERVPLNESVDEYIDYSREKAQEQRTPWGKSLGVGAGLGSAVGGLTGLLLHGGSAGATVGAGLGAILGTLTGASLKLSDDDMIEEAKQVLNSTNMTAAAKRQVLSRLVNYDAQNRRTQAITDETVRETVRSNFR